MQIFLLKCQQSIRMFPLMCWRRSVRFIWREWQWRDREEGTGEGVGKTETPATKKQVDIVFNKLNVDKDGVISFEEFIAFMKEYHLCRNRMNTDEVDRGFRWLIRIGMKSCLREFKHILTNLRNKFTEEEVEEIFRDLDKDGNISYRKFVEFWQEQ